MGLRDKESEDDMASSEEEDVNVGRRPRRKSVKGVVYETTRLSEDEEEEGLRNAPKILPCLVTRTSVLSVQVETFIGRRINEETGDIEYRVKFEDRSYLHLAWCTFEELTPILGGEYRDRMRIQSYERKLKRDGYTLLEDADELPDSSITIDCVLQSKQARLPTLREALEPFRRKITMKAPVAHVTGVFLYEHQDEMFDRLEMAVLRLLMEPNSVPFREPVDVDEVPHYLDHVAATMDLGTIASRLKRRDYYLGGSAHWMIFSDVMLVFDNCMAYNQDGSDIHIVANELKTTFQKYFNEWIHSPSAWLPSLDNWKPWESGCSYCDVDPVDDDQEMLLCDRCDGEYHLHCLTPPMKEIPEEDWFCPSCQDRNVFETLDESKRMEAMKPRLVSRVEGVLGVHEVDDEEYPRILWEPITSGLKGKVSVNDNATLSTNLETVYLVKWRGLSRRFCTWERTLEIPNPEMITRFKKFNATPSEAEIRRTVCPLQCCTSNVSMSIGYQNNNCCQKDKFCTLGYFHSGNCSRQLTQATAGSKENLRQRMVDQVRAQMYAYHSIMNNSKVDDEILKRCGMYTMAQAWQNIYFPKKEKAADEYDIDADDQDGDNDSEDLSDDDYDEFGRQMVSSNPFSKGISKAEKGGSDDEDVDEEGEVGEEVCTVLASMVEHIALVKTLPSLAPHKISRVERCEYNALIPKGPFGLGMRLGLTENGLVKCVGFQPQPDGGAGPAERTQLIKVGDYIIQVNQRSVVGWPFERMIGQIAQSPGMVILTFRTDRNASSFPSACAAKDVATDVICNSPYIIFPYSAKQISPIRVGVSASIQALQQIKSPMIVRWVQSIAPDGPLQHLFAAVCDNTVDILEHFRAFLPMHICEEMDRAKALKADLMRKKIADGEKEEDIDLDEFVPYEKSPTYKGARSLRPYQVEGLNWMITCWHARRSCILADEMGLGKTVQVVSVLEHLRVEESIRGPYLVVVPLSTIQHWRREVEDWTDMNVCVYHDVGDSRSNTRAKDMRAFIRQMEWRYETGRKGLFKFHILLTTYETLLADFEHFENIHWRLLVVDEAHRLKSNNSKALKRMRGLHIDRRLLLTGTPLQNNTQELWVLLNFLEPSQFDSFEDYNEKFGKLKTQEQVQDLQRWIAPYILRRVKEDVEKSIPPKEETIIEVELTTMQKRYYRAVYDRNRTYLYQGVGGGLPSLINIQMQLRKCCNHPFLIKGVEDREIDELGEEASEEMKMNKTIASSGKFVLVSKLLPKLKKDGHKVLIFSQFIKQLDLLEQYCQYMGYGVERLDGSVQGHERQKSIDRFSKKNSKIFVFLLSTRAGGVGINLIAADTVIIFDSDWNPQNDIQAQSRCHRIGQLKAVKVYRLITRNTFESEMFARASQKLGLEQAILGTASFNEASLVDNNQPSALELEQLLKRGAYGLAEDDDSAFRQFAERDIDEILQENAHVRIDKRGIDRSTFMAQKEDQDLSVDDPNFWEKVLPGAMSVELLKLKLQDKTALESEETIAKFVKNLQVATDTILEDMAEGKVNAGRVSHYDISLYLWQQVVMLKKHFSEVQRAQATDIMEVLHRSRVRSCRMDSKLGTAVVKKKKTLKRTKTVLKKSIKAVKEEVNNTAFSADGSFVDESEDITDWEDADVCALCGDGGLILFCDGPCHRSFHLQCVNMTDEPEDETWLCPDCEAGKQMCLECGQIGQVGGEDGVVQCSEGSCGRFYHRDCLKDHTKVKWVGRKRFKCPQHFCSYCDLVEKSIVVPPKVKKAPEEKEEKEAASPEKKKKGRRKSTAKVSKENGVETASEPKKKGGRRKSAAKKENKKDDDAMDVEETKEVEAKTKEADTKEDTKETGVKEEAKKTPAKRKRRKSTVTKKEEEEVPVVVEDVPEPIVLPDLVRCIHCPLAVHMACVPDPSKILRLAKHLLICRRHLEEGTIALENLKDSNPTPGEELDMTEEHIPSEVEGNGRKRKGEEEGAMSRRTSARRTVG